MILIKNIITKLLKKSEKYQPWQKYYSEENKNIKFTDKTVYDYMVDCVGQDRDFIAINYFGRRISYNEFFDKIDVSARAFSSIGVKQGDIVTICLPNTPEAVVSFYAVNKIGAVADMIHPLSSSNEISYYLNETGSRVLVLIDVMYEKVKDILSDTSVQKVIIVSAADSMPKGLSIGYKLTRGLHVKKPKFDGMFISWSAFNFKGFTYSKKVAATTGANDLAVILHSGGTTGKPKGIMITNFNFNASCQQSGLVVSRLEPQDKILTILPNFHGFGLCVSMHTPFCFRAEVILIPEFDGKRFHKIMKKYKPNVITGVPTLWEAMLSNKRFDDVDLSHLKYLISGGDYLTIAMEDKINNFLKEHGANICVSKGYGMTEAVAAVVYTFEGTNEPGAIGIPLAGNRIIIWDNDNDCEVPTGKEGEICVLSPAIMRGYYENDKETDKVVKLHNDGEKWLHTGDLGYITKDGIVYFTQRLKRMIVSSGFNVYPGQIEEVIESHPDVKKCCVIGVYHPYKMHVAKAFIVLKDGMEESNKIKKEIKELCKMNLAVYSIPKELEFRKELPKTLLNKIDFKKLEAEEDKKARKKYKDMEKKAN